MFFTFKICEHFFLCNVVKECFSTILPKKRSILSFKKIKKNNTKSFEKNLLKKLKIIFSSKIINHF